MTTLEAICNKCDFHYEMAKNDWPTPCPMCGNLSYTIAPFQQEARTLKEYYQQVPDKVWSRIRSIAEERELEFADNFRAFQTYSRWGFKHAHEIEKRGCCGTFNTTILVDGIYWNVGCNYGH